MNQQPTANRFFTLDDQLGFADWSGDHNPIHVDPVAVRRTGASDLVVHGVHNLLWCLDALSGERADWRDLSGIKVSFDSFVVIGDTVEVAITAQSDTRWRAQARVRGLLVMTIVLEFGACKAAEVPAFPATVRASDVAVELAESDILGHEGRVPFRRPDSPSAYPGAELMLGAGRVQALGAFTRIVGMECPGLNSIFNKIALDLTEDMGGDAVGYAVGQHHVQLRLLTISVWGGGWVGSLTASVRQTATSQPGMDALGGLLPADAFAGKTALVVGGSRGIGEVSAKLIASAGGSVIVTYAASRAEAERVVAEIVAAGGMARALQLDVTADLAPQLATLDAPITTLLYFATPPIGTKKALLFDAPTFDRFFAFYVTRLYDLIRLIKTKGQPLALLYPSTVYVEDRPSGLTEYAMAKAAGEQLCHDLMAADPELAIVVDRLPRLATDQNPGFAGDPIGAAVLPGLLRLVGR
jgi:acyl dehydratase